MSDLGKAFVQIVPSAEGIKGSVTKVLDPEAKNAGSSAGKLISGNIKKLIAAAGIGAAVTKSLQIGGDLQQSFGGLDTLYGDAADAAKAYAQEAYKAGISANTYAEQAVSFGASLKAAYSGDTTKAMQAANTAIMDMADNAAKMGTPIEQVQSAYQGFAKGQYMLLDNLKLGYGGTKTEMERLLKDAQAISGVEYNIDNLGDVYDAIHVIQGELGLTNVAAEEASETFTGSLNAMKAAGENLLGNLMLGENVGPAMEGFVQSVTTLLVNNLLPAVGRIILSLPEAVKTAIDTAAPVIAENFTNLLSTTIENAPEMAQSAIATIKNFGESIRENLPQMKERAAGIITTVVTGIKDNLPRIATSAGELIGRLAKGFVENLPQIASSLARIAKFILENLATLAGTLIRSGLNLIAGIARGIGQGLSNLLAPAMERAKNAIMKPIETAKEFIHNAIEKIKSIINGAKLELPRIKLPHFRIDGGQIPWGIGGKGYKPSIDIEWYRKAEGQPFMFKDSVLFGAGERNDEILYGRRSLMRDIKEATSEGAGNTFNIYNTINGAEDPEAWGRKMVAGAMLELRAL